MLKGLRSILPFYRPGFRTWSRVPQYEAGYKVKRVRILRPVFTLRRARTAAIYLGAFATFWHFVLDVEVEVDGNVTTDGGTQRAGREDNEERQEGAVTEANAQGKIAGSDEDTDDAIFIPLGRVRQRPKEYYKGSDQEWQSFVAFAHDKGRNALVRHQLVQIVGKSLAGAAEFQMFLGHPIRPHKYWLHVDYPDGPPPAYERGGLEITDNYIAWSTKPVSADNYARLQLVLYPTAAASVLWTIHSLLWSSHVARVKKFLNISSKPDPSRQPPPSGFLEFQPQGQRPTEQQPKPELRTKQSAASKPSERGPEGRSTDHQSSSPDSASTKIFPVATSIPRPTGFMSSTFSRFKRFLRHTWSPPLLPLPPPRGTFLVSGQVELVGPRGTCVLDVIAAYHPNEQRFVVISFAIQRARRNRQGPRGGP